MDNKMMAKLNELFTKREELAKELEGVSGEITELLKKPMDEKEKLWEIRTINGRINVLTEKFEKINDSINEITAQRMKYEMDEKKLAKTPLGQKLTRIMGDLGNELETLKKSPSTKENTWRRESLEMQLSLARNELKRAEESGIPRIKLPVHQEEKTADAKKVKMR